MLWYVIWCALFLRMEISSNRPTGSRAESGCTSLCVSAYPFTSVHLKILTAAYKLETYLKIKPTLKLKPVMSDLTQLPVDNILHFSRLKGRTQNQNTLSAHCSPIFPRGMCYLDRSAVIWSNALSRLCYCNKKIINKKLSTQGRIGRSSKTQ